MLESGLRKEEADGGAIDGGWGDAGLDDNGRGEEGRDCTGERVKGPEMKLPVRGESGWMDAGEVIEGEIVGSPLVAADLGTAEVLSHAGRVAHSRLVRSLDAPTVSGETTESLSWSLSLSSSWWWLFHWKPRPMEVTPQLLPTLAARYSRGPEDGDGIQSSSLSKVRSTAGAASMMPCKGGRTPAGRDLREREGVDDGGAEREREERNDG